MGRTVLHAGVALLAAVLLAGCEGPGYRTVSEPGCSEVIRVVSGDRIYFSLDEGEAAGGSWDFACDDPDVEVTIDHEREASGAPARAKVRIRIHRGYDGPSTVRFACRRKGGGGAPAKEFVITLYKRTGNVAFWE